MAPPTDSSIMLVNGRYFDHLAPDPSVIDLDVLEHGLAAPRFNNQTIRPISISEHSLRVRRIAVALWNGSDVDLGDLSLWALLHDAHEALVPWGDCLRPGKTDEMRRVESDIDVVICMALGIDPNLVVEAANLVKTADDIALYFEAMLWAPGALDWAPDLRATKSFAEACRVGGAGSTSAVERFMPLIAPRPGESWRTEVEKLLGKRAR